MTPRQFNIALGLIGSSQLAFAKVIKVNARTIRRWALGEAEVPTAVAMLLNLMLETQSTVKELKP